MVSRLENTSTPNSRRTSREQRDLPTDVEMTNRNPQSEYGARISGEQGSVGSSQARKKHVGLGSTKYPGFLWKKTSSRIKPLSVDCEGQERSPSTNKIDLGSTIYSRSLLLKVLFEREKALVMKKRTNEVSARTTTTTTATSTTMNATATNATATGTSASGTNGFAIEEIVGGHPST